MVPASQSFMQRMTASGPAMRTGGPIPQQRVQRGPTLQQILARQGGPLPQAGKANSSPLPTRPIDPGNNTLWQKTGDLKHDLFETIQRETRKGRFADEYNTIGSIGNQDSLTHIGANGPTPEQQKLFDKYGIKLRWRDAYDSGPKGESGISEMVPGGWEIADRGTYDQAKFDAARPKTVFGDDWRGISEKDKYKVKDPKYVTWDDNYGWITHRKNYDPDGDKSWFQRNIGNILPAVVGTALGGPAGTAIGLGMAGVKAASGQMSWQSLLPAILSAGLPMIPGFSGLGNLAKLGIRTGGNFAINNLINRGRRG
jgi:hypothetical protein